MFIQEILAEKKNGVQNTPMGFDTRYSSFPHYILDITEQIWEKRAIWLLYDTYAEDIMIHLGAKTIQGRDLVFESTIKTLYAFPDRTMKGEAVIWARYKDIFDGKRAVSESTNEQFFSSHRILSNATNTGPTLYGAVTGKKIFFRTIADCLAVDNVIFEEWLVRDNLFILRQLEFDPIKCAKEEQRYKGIDIESYSDKAVGVTKVQQEQLLSKTNSAESVVLSMIENIWYKKEFDKSTQSYRSAAVIHGICDINASDQEGYVMLWGNLFSSFPNAAIQIDQITSTYYDDRAEIAVRWRLRGLHTNAGVFGEASNTFVNILAINHFVVRDGNIVEEWFLYDAYDVLCQIHSNK